MNLKRAFLSSAILVITLTLAGCGLGSANPDVVNAEDSSKADPAVVALLPDSVKSVGKLVIGTDAAYPPNEYKDDSGNPIGWEIDLTNAVAAKLGLKAEYQIGSFDKIIPSIVGGAYDIGMSSFTDNVERQQQVDFVNYFQAGILWATPAGKTVDPANACGLKVAAQTGTYEATDEVPAKSADCVKAGKAPIDLQTFDAQDAATNATALGKVDAMSADSPVTLYAIKKSAGELISTGATFESAPYGIPLAKGSKLTPAIKAALESLLADGTYKSILSAAGQESGGITKITINAGS